jgi:two-component system, response regulator
MTPSDQTILLVDDSLEDLEMTTRALRHGLVENPIATASDGSIALDYLYRRGRYADREPRQPGLVLLDIKMPKLDGFGVLRAMKNDAELVVIPIVVFTSSTNEGDIASSYGLGASAYVKKPLDFNEFFATVARIGKFWIETNSTVSSRKK